MPKFEQTITISSADIERSLAIAYEAFLSSGWNIKYAGTDSLIGSTSENKGQDIVITIQNDLLTVNSESVSNNVFSSNAINKKILPRLLLHFKKMNHR